MYAATVNGQRLTFEVVTIYRRNMMMRDRQTGTLWQHATGEAVYGPLKGAQLEPLGGELIRWEAWKAEHPNTLAAIDPPDARRSFVPEHVLRFMLWRFTMKIYTPSLTRLDRRLPAHEEVVGLTLNGEAKAYPMALLRERGSITDQLGGAPVRLAYDPHADRVQGRRDNGHAEAIPVSRQWWLGWSEFHPGTDIYQP